EAGRAHISTNQMGIDIHRSQTMAAARCTKPGKAQRPSPTNCWRITRFAGAWLSQKGCFCRLSHGNWTNTPPDGRSDHDERNKRNEARSTSAGCAGDVQGDGLP